MARALNHGPVVVGAFIDFLLGLPVQALVWLIQSLPLRGVARLGRCLGAVAWHLDGRHRRVTLANLDLALGDRLGADERRGVAREHFRRLGENYACAIKTASMSNDQLRPHLELAGVEGLVSDNGRRLVAAVGHFGNFELYARVNRDDPSWRTATTYRALRPPFLNRILQSLRRRSGGLFFERNHEGSAVRTALAAGNVTLGLLCDQHAGPRGLWLPFLGRPCSTSAAPAIYALRFELPVVTAICYRVGLARWRIEVGTPIPTRLADGSRRPQEDIMTEVNRAFETAVLRDPANWFWVHRRWKPPSPGQAATPGHGSLVPGGAAERDPSQVDGAGPHPSSDADPATGRDVASGAMPG